MFDLALILA